LCFKSPLTFFRTLKWSTNSFGGWNTSFDLYICGPMLKKLINTIAPCGGSGVQKLRFVQSTCAFSLLLALLFSCKAKVPYTQEAFVEPYIQDSIPYTLALQKDQSEKLLIYIGQALDTVFFEETPLYQEIFKAGYTILCIYQAPAQGAFFYSRKSMDFRGQHIQNAKNLINHLRQQKRIPKAEHAILMGLGQGAYMLPALQTNFRIDTAIFINGSPFSNLLSLQRIAEGKMEWSPQRQDYIRAKFGIDSFAVFKQKVADVNALSSEAFSLGKYANMYWQSYHANYMMEDYGRMPGHAYWLFFEDHPLRKASDLDYLKVLDKTRTQASARYTLLEGAGNFDALCWEEISIALLPYFKGD
jgi:hypothetical protein